MFFVGIKKESGMNKDGFLPGQVAETIIVDVFLLLVIATNK